MIYTLCEDLDLLVRGRIARVDADRQYRTAMEILNRFETQPGVILADEVGMGKTFVALAVAISVALADRRRRPVVVMIPPALREKWPKDFRLFCSRCLPPDVGKRLSCGVASRPVEFLKLLDDPPARRKHIIFVTHGAMSRRLHDKWTKLALIAQAIKGRWGVDELRERLSWQLWDLLRMTARRDITADLWIALLRAPADAWLTIMQDHGVAPEGNGDPAGADDPVPEAVSEAIAELDLRPLLGVIRGLPIRDSKNYHERIRVARNELQELTEGLWRESLVRMRLKIPLLVLDEAHHLKNPGTQLAGLFQDDESRDDVEAVSRGVLAGAFERMLFLTATPFQLGHNELCNVLDRFDGIAWQGTNAPTMSRDEYGSLRNDLRRNLDAAQLAAVRLDQTWGRLTPEDLQVGGVHYADVETWWPEARDSLELTPTATTVLEAYRAARNRMHDANVVLQPWVIRHLRPRAMVDGGETILRRHRFPGLAIRDEGFDAPPGLRIEGDALLPFLLAARASITAPESRPLFAEGLASAYETFLHTRQKNAESAPLLDHDDEGWSGAISSVDDQQWYLSHLENQVSEALREQSLAHPKIDATVARTVALWESGEKVLVFCYYVITGRVLRERISQALRARINELAAARLGCNTEEAETELERLGQRFFDEDSPLRRACDAAVSRILDGYPDLHAHLDAILSIVRRFLRTPSFLARYLLRDGQELDERGFAQAMQRPDASGLSLEQIIDNFLRFLAEHPEDCERFLAALDSVQTGSHEARDVRAQLADDEAQGAEPERLLPNVRLVNGSTASDTRQRLMLTFNTPFYPEVLIASAVMAEGVDLHLNCRYVIHHDLSWNPSTLEQRTGRVDRIGAKCEQARRPVCVYYPYLAETQDEKMYRVVMDRERWFSVVMGEKFEQSARATEKLAERIPLVEAAARDLAFRLECK